MFTRITWWMPWNQEDIDNHSWWFDRNNSWYSQDIEPQYLHLWHLDSNSLLMQPDMWRSVSEVRLGDSGRKQMTRITSWQLTCLTWCTWSCSIPILSVHSQNTFTIIYRRCTINSNIGITWTTLLWGWWSTWNTTWTPTATSALRAIRPTSAKVTRSYCPSHASYTCMLA